MRRDAADLFPAQDIEQSIPQRFQRQARLQGSKVAVLAPGESLTYRQLDRVSERIAHRLLSAGVQRGDRVAFVFEQGVQQVAAILGILKAQAVYVPVDPRWPRERSRAVIDHSDPRVVLTDRLNQCRAELLTDRVRLLWDESGRSVGSGRPGTRKLPPLTFPAPDDNACIYYTSGSTGTPKGVVDVHRNVLHNIRRYTDNLCITADDRITLLQPCGFSGAVSNIFSALLNGGTLLPVDVKALGPRRTALWLAAAEPTIYHSVPSMFRALIRTGIPLPSLRIIRLEGDAASWMDVELFKSSCASSCTLVHGLGATETGIVAQYFVTHEFDSSEGPVPVGKSTENMEISVVDARGRCVAPDERGEIVITSRYLASGYWNRRDLTENAFTDLGDGRRRYRTGDQGFLGPDGNLTVLGRSNFSAAPSDAVPDLSMLESLPLDSNGKVDRSALVARLNGGDLDPVAGSPDGSGDEPRTDAERQIAEVYRSVLGLGRVGIHSDFYDLGGDSLLAVEAATQLSERFDADLVMGAFQHATTVASLAEILARGGPPGTVVALQTKGSGTPFYCVHAHMGHTFNLDLLGRALAPDQPFYGLQARGLDGLDTPSTNIEEMAAEYVAAIVQHQQDRPFALAGYCLGSWIAVEMTRQIAQTGGEVALLALIDPDLPGAFSGRSSIRDRVVFGCWKMLSLIRRRLVKLLPERGDAGPPSSIDVNAPAWAKLNDASEPPSGSMVRVRRALRAAAASYEAHAYEGPVSILLPEGKLTRRSRPEWQRWFSGPVSFVELCGSSRDLMRDPTVRQVADVLLLQKRRGP